MDFTTRPRGHHVERDGKDRNGKARHRIQVQHVAEGDTLGSFGKVLALRELPAADGWRMFYLRTEHPKQWPEVTDEHTVPEFLYYPVTALAD
ncbi:hypothetical protein [Streptomyces sp. NPDC026673]|uniref:hypothetical protein n=1 Tax=Streptomyces sp. NPDC026673 TaxID=3155724 RepID=UPI0034116AEB